MSPPTEVTVSGIVIDLNPELAKVRLPIEVTDPGIVIVLNPELPKASSPIEVTVSGIVTDTRLLQLLKLAPPYGLQSLM